MAANQNKPSSFPPWGTNDHKYIEEIGSGGFGTVYKAQGLYDQKTYAVKQVSVQHYQNYHSKFEKDTSTWKSKLLQEVHFLTKLESEFVMRYYGCGFHGPNSQNYLNDQEDPASEVTSRCITTDWFYIKMEYCEEDLKKWIDKNNLEEREPHKISIINQILKGLEYIHRQQVIHRDIKPANIMLKKVLNSQNTNSFQAKIGDFGLSKLVEVSKDSLDSLQVGTRIYMSPEMSLGSKYSYKTDIYSAGLVFFEMLNPTLSKTERDKIFNEFIRNGNVIVYATTGDSQNEVKLIQNMTKMNEDDRLGALELLLAYEQDTNSRLGDANKPEGPCNNVCSPLSSLPSHNLNPLQMAEVPSGLHDFKRIGNNLKWPISYGVTSSVKNFWGRKKELKQLKSFFSNNKKLVLICGIGGIGKTELSRKFMDKIKKYGYNCFTRSFLKIVPCNSVESPSRIWLHGDTLEAFQSSVSSFASKLGVANDKGTPSEMFKYLTEMTLEQSQKLVVVIDNVDTRIEEVSECIKLVRDYENIFMIVTSRNKMILDNAGETMLLDVLSQENARNMLRNCIENISDSDADLLCELVQNYPLALQQAVAYIKEQRENFESPTYSVSDYVKEFEEKKLEMLDKRLNEFEHDYALTTLVTWDVTFDKLSEDAVELLKTLAFLDPDFIEIEFCKGIWRCEFGLREGFEVAVNLLRKYSLIKVEGLRISIHRLVQEVMRLKAEVGFLKNLFHLILVDFSKERFYKYEHIFERICILTYGIELGYPNEYQFKYKESWDPKECLNCMRSEIALELSKKNKNEDALEFCVEVLSSNYPKELYFYGFEAIFRIYKSNSALVVQCIENVFESRKSILGYDHEITTIFKLVLAVIYNHNGKTEKSLPLFSQVKSYHDKHQLLEDFLLLTTLLLNTDEVQFRMYSSGSFDNIYHKLELEYLERLLPCYKYAFGENGIFTLKIKNAIARKYFLNYEYEKCLEIVEKIVILKNPRDEVIWDVKSAYNMMGHIKERYYKKGKYKEARGLLERSLQKYT